MTEKFQTSYSPVADEDLGRGSLSLDQVGVLTTSLNLGGHSRLATQVVSRVSDTFKSRLPMRAFFEQPTVAGLDDFMAREEDEHRETIPQSNECRAREFFAPRT